MANIRGAYKIVEACIWPILIVAFLGSALVFALWLRTSAPCGWYKYAENRSVPARCTQHFNSKGDN